MRSTRLARARSPTAPLTLDQTSRRPEGHCCRPERRPSAPASGGVVAFADQALADHGGRAAGPDRGGPASAARAALLHRRAYGIARHATPAADWHLALCPDS